MTPFEEYLAIEAELKAVDSESAEADEIRERAEKVWYRLSEAEMRFFNRNIDFPKLP